MAFKAIDRVLDSLSYSAVGPHLYSRSPATRSKTLHGRHLRTCATQAEPSNQPRAESSYSNGNGNGYRNGNGNGNGKTSTLTASPNLVEDQVLRDTKGSQVYVNPEIKDDGGPPRFFSPLIPNRSVSDPSTLPMMLYLPGIDGTGLAASPQFPFLVEAFDLRCFFTPANDRTPFDELVATVRDYLTAEVATYPVERPVYLLGESFGAVLAVAVAAECHGFVDRVVLVNPATSFPRSVWPNMGPLVGQIPKDAYPLLPFALAPFLSNPILMAANGVDNTKPLPEQVSEMATSLVRQLGILGQLSDILPGETLLWKIELLDEATKKVEPLISKVQQRTLVLVADQDLLIPSKEEGPRLARKLPRAQLKVLEGHSHAALREAGVDLVKIMQEQGFYVKRRTLSAPSANRQNSTFGGASPIELPTLRELDISTAGLLENLRRLTSPVFLSTYPDGSIVQGLEGVPASRPLVFVGNHQTFALDMGLMVEEFIRQKYVLLRGLAHPAIFEGGVPEARMGGDDEQQNAFTSFLVTYGAVPVGGFNFHKLLKQGEAVFLYPGGVREAYHNRGEQYQLFWPNKPEFVRMAAKFGATIVPFGGVGAYDSVEFVADSKDILSLPVLGKMAEDRAKNIPAARRGALSGNNNGEMFVAPVALPKPPARFYYMFGKPIPTSPSDLKDKDRVMDMYLQSKSGVEDSIAYLLRKRESDPFKDLLPRLLYEATWRKQAPTFKL